MDITSSLLFLQVILYGYLYVSWHHKNGWNATDGICNIHSPALFIKTGAMSKKKSTTPVNSDVCDEKHIGRSYVKGQLQKKHYNINYAATYKWTWLEGNIYQFGGGGLICTALAATAAINHLVRYREVQFPSTTTA